MALDFEGGCWSSSPAKLGSSCLVVNGGGEEPNKKSQDLRTEKAKLVQNFKGRGSRFQAGQMMQR